MPCRMDVKRLQIGPVPLATNLLVAPISGYTDVSYRLVARSCGGVGLACTDLLCPEGVVREGARTMQLAATCPEDSPLCMQLYGGEADRLCEAARWAEDHGAHVIDINMGCPVDKITKRDGGSKLLCNPDNTLRMVERIIRALKHAPLTAKLRLGWDDSAITAPYLASRLEQLGVAAITIHGRTTEMRFSGTARLDGIASVVSSVRRIPVIGNGDIRSPEDAKRMMEATGCAGVMVGRFALCAPWIFRDIWSYLTTGIIPPKPTLEEICQLMRDHFNNLVRFRDVRTSVVEFRKRVRWYATQMHPCRMLKEKMRFMNTPGDFEGAIAEFLEWRRTRDEDRRRGMAVADEAEEPAVEAV